MSRETCNNVATNLQRAIRHFENVRDKNFITLAAFKMDLESGDVIGSPIVYENRDLYYNTALAAMREQLERENGCEYCNAEVMDGNPIFHYHADHYIGNGKFSKAGTAAHHCPMCGRRLKENNHE